MCEICDENISKEKYKKTRNYLFKMKELNEIVLEKGKVLFPSIKGKLFDKRASGKSKRASGGQIAAQRK